MKILILPDIHGRDFWKEPCSHINEFDKVVFLGDYHDPYTFQVSKDTSRHQLRDELVPWIEEHKDKCICLVGNHDIEYLIGVYVGCRYDYAHEKEIESYFRRMPLQLTYLVDGYLFSHSGILPEWLNRNKLQLENLNSISLGHPALMDISRNRGGDSNPGSCIWGDLMEYANHPHLENLYQIFGHTQLNIDKGYIDKDFACLDCRQAYALNTETKQLVLFKSYNNNENN